MIDVTLYISRLTELLTAQFGERLKYIGLQGSYQRGEATDSSDLDIMVILDQLRVTDLAMYRSAIQTLEDFDKSCGFICGVEDLLNWNPMEICNLLHSTQDCFGVLEEWVPAYTMRDVRNFVKLSLNNLYHELCHRYIHGDREKNIEKLPGTYKGVFFILQNLYWLRYGKFVGNKEELLQRLSGRDYAVLLQSIKLKNMRNYDFDDSFKLLFVWCQETMHAI